MLSLLLMKRKRVQLRPLTMTYLFGTYNDMPLKQNPETITLQSCLCER
ncbi:hypothetical protein T11_16176 [Trichinella zimbabwensis]|uniref:Uncharacterized protein n=1 Tax=Trichinella zimbabwensis TaxID=268475 RepID=A0A0V1F3H7_9BILA|nr:hypothetical protein T11_16176 [Trichinella zimbabwensis]